MWPIRTRLPAPWPPEIITPYFSRTCPRTWTSVNPSGTVIAVTQAAVISSVRGQSSSPRARIPAWQTRAASRELVPLDRAVEPLLEQLVAGCLDPVHVRDGWCERELATFEPLLLPVEQRQERCAGRRRVLADARPRVLTHAHERHPRRATEALLRPCHAHVELPLARLERNAADGRDAIDESQCTMCLRDRSDLGDRVDRPAWCLAMD